MGGISTTEAARELGVPTPTIVNLFYRGYLDEFRCERIAGRRIIPLDYLPEIAAIMSARGLLPVTEPPTT